MVKKVFAPKLIKQVRYLLLNKDLSVTDIERILRYQISWTTIAKIYKGICHVDTQGYEPPDDYDEYARVYVKSKI
jgi:hypothetical protein